MNAAAERTSPNWLLARVLRWDRPAAIFVVFLVPYLFTWAGHYTTGDGAQKVAWAKAILSGAPHGVYSKYGIGHTLIAIPTLVVSNVIQKATGFRCEAALYTLLFILNGALFLYLAALYLLPRYGPKRAWLTVALMGLCTWWWPYTKLDFSEPLVATFFLGGVLLLKNNRPRLGMIVAGYIILIRPDALLMILVLLLWRVWTIRRLELSLGLVCGVYVAIYAYTNFLRWGSPFTGGYAGENFSTPFFVGLYGMLISSGKSVFLFAPPLLLAAWGFSRFWRSHRDDALLFLAVFASQLLLYSTWWSWPGDDAWGSRFVIPSVMLCCIPAVEVLDRRFLVCAIALLGLAVQVPAVITSAETYMSILRNFPVERELVYLKGPPNRVDFDTMRFDPQYNPIRAQWVIAGAMLGIDLNRNPLYASLRKAGWDGKVTHDLLWLRLGAALFFRPHEQPPGSHMTSK